MGATDLSIRGRVYSVRPPLAIFAFGALLFIITGCNTTCSTPDCAPVAVPVVADGPPTTGKVQDPDDVKYYRSDEPLRMGNSSTSIGAISELPNVTSATPPKRPQRIPPPGSAWRRPMTGLRALILPIAPMLTLSGLWGETTEILNNQATVYATG